MKKTLFVTMLAAALLGGQVFAAPTGTAVDNCGKVDGTIYYGTYSDTGSATGGNVTIKADEQGDVPNNASVYGGYASVGDASSNILTMTGGRVASIYGGYGNSASSNNTVVMTGGVLSNNLYVAQVQNKKASASASENVAIITGGTISNALTVASATEGTLTNNRVHLVGKGASNVSIVNGQGSTSSYSYTGSDAGIKVAFVMAAGGSRPTLSGNSIDIYGTGITVSHYVSGMQILTFNITDGQVTGRTTEAALSLTSTAGNDALKLQGVALQVNDLDVQEWKPGTTITLVEAKVAIQGLSDPKEVNIMRGDVVTATATLKLNEDNTQLLLTNIQGVPEPATGSLSLLALAGLCIRRRRK